MGVPCVPLRNVLHFCFGIKRFVGEEGARACLELTRGESGLPKGERSIEFSLSEELLWRWWANFFLSASAMREAGSLGGARPVPPLRRGFTGLPPGDLRAHRREKCSISQA